MALRTLVTSIFHTLKSLMWAMVLLMLIVYVFAVLFTQDCPTNLMTLGMRAPMPQVRIRLTGWLLMVSPLDSPATVFTSCEL